MKEFRKLGVLILGFVGIALPQTPLACNVKALTPAQRVEWRKQMLHVMDSVEATRELPDGYSLKIDRRRASVVDVARWIDLERRCCPFFTFELNMQGEGAIWLNLRGSAQIKDFITSDFRELFERLAKTVPSRHQ